MTKDELLDKLDEAQTNEEIREISEELLTQDPGRMGDDGVRRRRGEPRHAP